MTWVWLESAQTLQHIGLLFNCFVHIIMYYYYALVSLKIRVWWKKYITKLQIVQFLTSIVCWVPSAYYMYFADETKGTCNGYTYETWYSIYLNALLNLSLLWSFNGVKKRNEKVAAAESMKKLS